MYDDDDSDHAETATEPPRRSRALLITVASLVVLFLAFTGFSSFWTERLWFGSVGYQDVFTTLLRTKVGLFAVFGLLMALAVGANLLLAYRFRPIFRPSSPEQVSLDRYREAVTPIRTLLLVGVSIVIGLFAGATASGKWREYLLWRNGVDFGRKDPYFHRDIGFYVFDLPWLHYLVDFAMAVAVISLIAAAIVHYLYGGIRLQSQAERFSSAAAAQLSLLTGIFVLAKAADYWLDRFDLLNESGSLITGVTYTDDNAVLPARNILMFIALICAVLFLVNIVLRTWLLPSVGLALLVLSSILLGLVWPGIVQQFQVEPSQADKEQPYIKKNIDATRAAYDLEDSVVTPYSGTSTLTSDQQAEEIKNVPGIRLVDPALIKATFEQRQQVTRYYSVVGNPDVDRYKINGIDRDVVVAARELDQDGLPDDGKNWSNLHTVYTHGYGVIAAFGNQRDVDNKTQTSSDDPVWAETDIPPRGELTDLTPDGYRGQIYFGEKSPEYSVVGKASPSSPNVELDLPNGEENSAGSTTNTYDGAAGVGIGDLFHKMLYAWKFGEPNLVLSGRVNENSKILYDRNPRQMVEKVAPWLTVDQDPFPAVVDGKIVWLLDGYTTTDQYPLSQRASFEEMTSDALDSGNEFRTLPTDEINYMRNAVKATVDAYDGTVTLYAWDESDPLLKAWRDAFPGTVKDKSEIPQGPARAHALPGGPVQGAALPAGALPRHRRERLLREQRPLGGRQGPGGDRQAAAAVPSVGPDAQRVGGAGVLADLGLHAVPPRQPGLVRGRRCRRVQRGLRNAAGADVARQHPDPGSGPDRQPVRLERDHPERAGPADAQRQRPGAQRQPAHAAGRRHRRHLGRRAALRAAVVRRPERHQHGELSGAPVRPGVAGPEERHRQERRHGRRRRARHRQPPGRLRHTVGEPATVHRQPEQRRPAGHRGRPAATGGRGVQGGRQGAQAKATSARTPTPPHVPSGSSSGRWPRPRCPTRPARVATDPRLRATRFGASPRGR